MDLRIGWIGTSDDDGEDGGGGDEDDGGEDEMECGEHSKVSEE